MNYSFAVQNNILYVYVSGDFDLLITESLKASIDAVIKIKGLNRVIFDLTKVSFIDSSGLGLILSRYKTLAPLGGKVSVIGANPQVYRILALSGLDRVLKIEPLQHVAE